MADINLSTSIDAIKTKILNSASSATVEEISSYARAARAAGLDQDSAVETAINDRVTTLASTGTAEEVRKLAATINQIRNAPVTSSILNNTDQLSEGTENLYYTDARVGAKISTTDISELTDTTGLLGSGGITTYTDMSALIAATGMSNGDQAFVTANNNLYLYSGTGWYKIATVQNDSPSAITGVNGSYSLAIDGTPTVITAVSTDPEGFPLTWTYSTSGLGSIATISQVDNVFTITPSTDTANIGTFTLTINATDGVNGAVSANTSITLQFHILNSNYTTLLATAVDTSNNSSFTDSSTNALTLSPIDAPISSSFSPYRHGGYSAYFNANGLSAPAATGTTLQGVTTFTVEFWYNTKTVALGNKVIWGSRSNTSNTDNDDTIGRMFQTGGSLYYQVNGSTVFNVSSVFSTDTWYYIALVVDQGAASLYIDGTRVTTGTYTSANGLDKIIVGHTANSPQQYIADFRITTDAEYSGTSHTVPSEPLSTTPNTVFHLPTKAYFPSGVSFYLNPVITPFTPYDNLEYSAVKNGGSIYFTTSGSTGTSGGTGQYVQSSLSSGLTLDTNDFTIDCWVYGISKASNYPRILQIGPQNTPWGASQLALLYKHNDDNDSICLAMQGIGGSTMLIASGPINDNQWYHVAVTRSGSTFTLYINGESVGTYTSTGSATGTGDKAILIGSSSAGDSDFNGYISDLRVINGTVVYTGNFTPPTEPVSSSGAAVHLIGTDASIIDKSQRSNLTLVGNTTGSTTQVKFGGSKSIYFDGTGDYAIISKDTVNLNALDKDFTIEFWLYDSSPTTWKWIAAKADNTGNESGNEMSFLTGQFANQTDGKLYYNNSLSSYVIGTNSAISANTWYHVAVVRNNNVFTMFLDGVAQTSTLTNSGSVAVINEDLILGGHQYQISTLSNLNGYIQDFRFTNGLARYTANFTPPTEPLKG